MSRPTSKFWKFRKDEAPSFHEDFHTPQNRRSLNLAEIHVILKQTLENDSTDKVLRRVLTNVCGLVLSSVTPAQLSELKKIILTPGEPDSRAAVERKLEPWEDDKNVYKPLPKIITRVREWATANHIPLEDAESPDGFTLFEKHTENSNRTIGENEEPDVSEDDAITVEDEDDEQ